MTGRSELRLVRVAHRDAAKPVRHALMAFLAAVQLDRDMSDDILTAVGEALANAVEHAYDETDPGDVEMYARVEDEQTLAVDVYDRGSFIERDLRPGRGLGLRIVRAIARAVSIDTDGGTRVRMVFDARPTDAGGAQAP